MSRRLVVLAPLLLAVACAPQPGPDPADDAPVLRPGDPLLERLIDVAVTDTSVPPREQPWSDAVDEALAAVLELEAAVVATGSWTEGPAHDDLAGLAVGLGSREVRRFRALPPLHLDLGLGPVWLEHEGRPMTSLVGSEATARLGPAWLDAEAGLAVVWDEDRRGLLALGPRPPGELRYGYRDPAASELAAWEPEALARLTGRAVAPFEPGRRVTLDGVERPCLAVRGARELSLPVGRVEADGLELALAVLPHALTSGRTLMRAPRLGDGVVFTIDVEVDGVRGRAFTRRVLPGEEFVEARCDLSRWRGREVVLRLGTASGNGADLDHALWSGLRAFGASTRAPARPHVVLIDVDTLRADRLGSYGYERDTSPRLDAWAAERAVVHTDCVSANDWTLPSTASLLTGLAVHQHEVTAFPAALGASATTLAEHLSAAGYETWARTDAGFLVPTFGFSRGFERFEVRRRPAGEHQAVGWGPELERVAARASEAPLFFFLHTYQVHAPFALDRRYDDPERPYDGPLAEAPVIPERVGRLMRRGGLDAADRRFLDALYDAGVRRMDDVVGDFLEGLEELLEGQELLVILTSDHGEELLDHAWVGHGHGLHRELLQVPLLVRFPHGRPGRQTVPVSGLDVVPTVLDVVGLDVPAHLPGRSLAEARLSPRPQVAQHGSAHAFHWNGSKLVRGRLSPGRGDDVHLEQLFQHGQDPSEQEDRADVDPGTVERLGALLDAWLAGHPPLDAEAAEVDPAVLADLQALGYVELR